MKTETIGGHRQTGRTTRAFKILEGCKSGVYITDSLAGLEYAKRRFKPGRHVQMVVPGEIPPNRLRGYHFDAIVLDNAEFLNREKLEPLLEVIVPALEPGGRYIEVRGE